MRPIKFRIWSTALSRYRDTNIDLDGDREIFIHDDGIPEQFIGLHDKDGTEIYECDIVDYDGIIGEVKYTTTPNVGFVIVRGDESYSMIWSRYCTKVIGNIHQHPELLNERN